MSQEAFAGVLRQAEQGFVSDESLMACRRRWMLGMCIPFSFLTVLKPEGRLQLGGVKQYQCESVGKAMRPSSLQTQCLPPATVVDRAVPALHAGLRSLALHAILESVGVSPL